MQNQVYHVPEAYGKPLCVQKTEPHLGREAPYIYVPHNLLNDCYSSPLAIGIWIVIGRLNKRQRGGIPLSAADLAHWLGHPKDANSHKAVRAAIMRAIDQLITLDWLQVERERGMKHTLLCTWGQLNRPWDFSQPGTGRPTHVRGVQVPAALCDLYIGELTPKAGRAEAHTRSYLTRPLLDLKDIGVYALARYTIITVTPRLQHLNLADEQGVYAPLTLAELKQQLIDGHITTLDDNGGVQRIGFRDQGFTAPNIFFAPLSGSSCGSPCGSNNDPVSTSHLAHIEAENSTSKVPQPTTRMDDQDMIPQEIKDSTAILHDLESGDGSPNLRLTKSSPDVANKSMLYKLDASGTFHEKPTLDPAIVAHHQALNPQRVIAAGEWYELVDLVAQNGVKRMLIWQARAARSRTSRPDGITPAYYVMCAGREALAIYHPPRAPRTKNQVEKKHECEGVTDVSHTAPKLSQTHCSAASALDPERESLMADIEAQAGQSIIIRDRFATVSIEVLRAWRDRAVVQHPGLAIRFSEPLNFAVEMLRNNRMPPSDRQLERWYAQRQQEAVEDYAAAFRDHEVNVQKHHEHYIQAFPDLHQEDEYSEPMTHSLYSDVPARPAWIAAHNWVELPIVLQQALDGSIRAVDGTVDVRAACYELLTTTYKDELADLLALDDDAF